MTEDQAMITAKIDALTARAEAAEETIRQLQRKNDSLWLEKEATNHARLKDNAYLIKRAEEAEAKVARLREPLHQAATAIKNAPREVFGIGGEGETHWYLADELVLYIETALAETEPEERP